MNINEIKTIDMSKLPPSEGYEYGPDLAAIRGERGYIVTANDFVHGLYDNTEEIHIPMWKVTALENGSTRHDMFPSRELTMSLEELEQYLGDTPQLDQWGHSFGIKPRIASNYRLLQKSCKEIGAYIGFPPWNRRNPRDQIKEQL